MTHSPRSLAASHCLNPRQHQPDTPYPRPGCFLYQLTLETAVMIDEFDEARPGMAWQGMDQGIAGQGLARHGKARQGEEHGTARLGVALQGLAWNMEHGTFAPSGVCSHTVT